MGKYPITNKQWRVVMQLPTIDIELPHMNLFSNEKNDYPVETVNWHEALEFCNRLTAITGKNITLPSESQWEYCCKAGTNTTYSFGDKITPELANYNNNVGDITPIKSYPPNPWGIYDMHGNLNEWCLDDWHDNYEGAPIDGSAWLYSDDTYYGDNDNFVSQEKVIRGGNFFKSELYCTSVSRDWDVSSTFYPRPGRKKALGFRICCNN